MNTDPLPMHRYTIYNKDGVEIDCVNVIHVNGRRVETGLTIWSAVRNKTTRQRWKKMMKLIHDAGFKVTVEPWNGHKLP